MVARSRYIGWSLMLASSLTWFGCQLEPRHTSDSPPQALTTQLPTSAPPLQIATPYPLASPSPLQISADVKLPELPANRAALAPPPAAHGPETPLRTLHRLAAERFAATPAYIARFKRRERFEGTQRAEELILFKYRKDPASIYMHWLGDEAHNREVVLVRGRYDDMVHIAPGTNDAAVPIGTGKRTIMRPDSPQGLGKERYPVAETGIGALIDRYGRLVTALEGGDGKIGTAKYLGPVNRPEFDAPVEVVMHLIPAGAEHGMPRGGQRLWYFDSTLHFPVLVIAHDADGREVEYYCFNNILFPGHVPSDEEFNPANLGRR